MVRRAYILVFDKDDFRDYNKIHNLLTTLPEIVSWFHYIKSSYILIATTENATALSKSVKRIFHGKRFLIVEANLKDRNGWLPQQAWEWLRKQVEKLDGNQQPPTLPQ